ncbi:putative nuclease HARBI1 [Dendronephthya gigantea]|uniref:putative nuclease HARBI1 n=1 Tax=Dendronephthya gigantea TaxID=151771 RepID=UPI00106CF0D8|nr:putative nuclease HARBI1 [Dendronephthya gigantea]
MADVLQFVVPIRNFPRRQRRYRHDNVNIRGLTDAELRIRYRFGYQAINYITNLLYDDLIRDTKRNFSLIPDVQVLIALRFFASGSFLQVIGDTFGVDKSTVSRVVRDVCLALSNKREQFIRWPSNQEKEKIKNGFYDMANFPGVIGCIDCTHIRIQAPHLNENYYVNRKRYHSINVQAICDDRGKLLYSICTNYSYNYYSKVGILLILVECMEYSRKANILHISFRKVHKSGCPMAWKCP